MAKRRANKTPNRLRWVIDTFPYFVAERVMGGVAQYQGYERFPLKALPTAKTFLRAKTAYPWLELFAGAGEDAKQRLYDELKNFRDTRELDKYIPWLAAQLNAAYRPVKKTAKRVLKHRDKTGKFWLDESSVAYDDFMNYSSGEGRIGWLSFGAIATWAHATGEDLSEWDLPSAATTAMEWIEEHGSEVEVSQGDVVYEFADGWTIQRLRTQEEFWNETQAMGHCVGKLDQTGSYYSTEELAGIEFDILSLRDPKGKPHATIELDLRMLEEPSIEQIRGKGNTMPKPKYMGYIACYVAHGMYNVDHRRLLRDPTPAEEERAEQLAEAFGVEIEHVVVPTADGLFHCDQTVSMKADDLILVVKNPKGRIRGEPSTLALSAAWIESELEKFDHQFQKWWDETGYWSYVGDVASRDEFDSDEEFEQWEQERAQEAYREQKSEWIPPDNLSDDIVVAYGSGALALWAKTGHLSEEEDPPYDVEFYEWLGTKPEEIWKAYLSVCGAQADQAKRAANKLKRRLMR